MFGSHSMMDDERRVHGDPLGVSEPDKVARVRPFALIGGVSG